MSDMDEWRASPCARELRNQLQEAINDIAMGMANGAQMDPNPANAGMKYAEIHGMAMGLATAIDLLTPENDV